MNLSGGQKRKLCVGVALVGNPKVLMICLRHKSKSVECLHGHIIRCKKNYFYRFGAEYVLFFFLIQNTFRKFWGFCVLFLKNQHCFFDPEYATIILYYKISCGLCNQMRYKRSMLLLCEISPSHNIRDPGPMLRRTAISVEKECLYAI